MRLLLDTCALIWFLDGDASLSAPARAAIEDTGNERYVSHATAWETAIKVSIGKLQLPVPHEDLFPDRVLAEGFLFLPMDLPHHRLLLTLPLHHRDPFDRMLIVQAQAEGLTIISNDGEFPAYNVPLLW